MKTKRLSPVDGTKARFFFFKKLILEVAQKEAEK